MTNAQQLAAAGREFIVGLGAVAALIALLFLWGFVALAFSEKGSATDRRQMALGVLVFALIAGHLLR